ncbi:MAG: UvrD-helicase domain-containing protein [Pseudomonadota bacterium]|nr:UvrD-helicase domain-containing protein [Pseudomonadota bacterium]
MKDITVVISQEVFRRMPSLPASIGKKFPEWLVKFQANPDSPGINYEVIRAAKDKNLRSVRIDQDWRGIVLKPDSGSVYVLLHIDKHDDAYAWAERHQVRINPVQGSIQVVNTTYVEETVAKAAEAPPEGPSPIFAEHSDRDLVSLGVPEEMLPAVRTIRSEGDLDAMRDELPVEGYEGLFLLLAGDTVESIRISRETRVDTEIDTSDFDAAVKRDASRARFYVVEGQEALEAVIAAPMEQWKVFLHPTQRRLATKNINGSARILGGAGTGKTVLAIHRAKHLSGHFLQANEKLLFTTYTTNLALDVEDALQSLCGGSLPRNIEVLNLDAWVYRYLRAMKYEHQILFDFAKRGEEAWQRSMTLLESGIGLDSDFVREEFEQVVLAQGLNSLDAYRQAPRRGRGSILARSKRDKLWVVFEEYRLLLSGMGLKEPDDAYADAAALLEEDERKPFRCIVVDETQDFGPQALRLIRAMAPRDANDLMFVGDGHQRIYAKNRAVMSKCGIDIRGRSSKLYLNYRTTEEIRQSAIALLEGVEIDDLDGEHDEMRRYKSLMRGARPVVLNDATFETAMPLIVETIRAALDGGPTSTVGVMAPNAKIRNQIKDHLTAQGIVSSTVEHKEKLARKAARVFLMTLHRAKGLEFDAVCVVAKGPLDDGMRKLAYVGMTRAKKDAALAVLA